MIATTDTPVPTDTEDIAERMMANCMADSVTAEDVARRDTTLVLMRSGWTRAEIEKHIDAVEAIVLRREEALTHARAL